ncbi:DUF5320 domain-containing protein [Sunxiuqinia sp. A32]|uniref:DUF5320 domain-containing protein n=1 Tax=Sunxiuqinia sp. A32 TaxID=3461496 RepID=UPI004045639D
MPGFNSKGPLGKGPETGRKLGKCADKNEDSFKQSGKIKIQDFPNASENFEPSFGIGQRRGLRRRNSWNRGFRNKGI